MGVLDDAIREHLDLKRRHGAAEEELRRQEAEALGPARREVAPAETDDGNGTGDGEPVEVEAAQTAPAAQDELPDVEPEHGEGPELSEALPASAVHSDVVDEDETALYEAAPQDPEALQEDEPLGEEAAPAATAPHDEPAFDDDDEEDDRRGDTPPQGYEAFDDEPFDEEAEPAEGDGDVLEDTPDFLQETPEHDRLWFEQKPPRDFDFD
jgi:hypothetical protein